MPRRALAIIVLVAGCSGEVIEGTGPQQASTGEPASTDDTGTTDAATTVTPTTATSDTPTSDTPTSDTPTTTDATTTSATTATTDATTGTTTGTTGAAVCGDAVVEGDELCDDGNPDQLDGCTTACSPPRSCLDLWTLDMALPDGPYAIDPELDGTPFMVLCDMTNGGWTRVVDEGLSDTDGWTGGQLSTCGELGGVLGGAGQLGMGGALEKTFDLLQVPHTQVRVTAEFAIIDSWDGEEIFVEVAGQKVASKICQFTDPNSCGQTKNQCGDALWPDGALVLVGAADHAEASALLHFGSTLNEGPTNEAWGLDTVELYVK